MAIQIDIAELLALQAVQHLAKAYNFKSAENDLEESGQCIQAIILFQVCMEAVINEEIERAAPLLPIKKENKELSGKFKSLSFKNKWEKAFDLLEIHKRKELRDYFTFYTRYRVLLSHPKSRYVSLDNYMFDKVYAGIKSGWDAMQIMYAVLGKSKISWEEICLEAGLLMNK